MDVTVGSIRALDFNVDMVETIRWAASLTLPDISKDTVKTSVYWI